MLIIQDFLQKLELSRKCFEVRVYIQIKENNQDIDTYHIYVDN